jgi:hypothetical protein
MTDPLRRMQQDMRIRNLSPRTIECYLRHVAAFARHFGKSPEQLDRQHIREYQIYLVEQRHASWSLFNLSGMIHLFVNLLQGKELADSDRRLAADSASFSRPRRKF